MKKLATFCFAVAAFGIWMICTQPPPPIYYGCFLYVIGSVLGVVFWTAEAEIT
jgi:hypothetical protein